MVGSYQAIGERSSQQDRLFDGLVHHFHLLSAKEQDDVIQLTYQQVESTIENDIALLGGATMVGVVGWINNAESKESKEKESKDTRTLHVQCSSLGDARGFVLILDQHLQVKTIQRLNPALHSVNSYDAKQNEIEREAANYRGGQFGVAGFLHPFGDKYLVDAQGNPSISITGSFLDIRVSGVTRIPYVNQYQFPLAERDSVYFFAATDGLTDFIDDAHYPELIGVEAFIANLKAGNNLNRTAEVLVDAAIQRGVTDNTSLIIGQIKDNETPAMIAAIDGHGIDGHVIAGRIQTLFITYLQNNVKAYCVEHFAELRDLAMEQGVKQAMAKLYNFIPEAKTEFIEWKEKLHRQWSAIKHSAVLEKNAMQVIDYAYRIKSTRGKIDKQIQFKNIISYAHHTVDEMNRLFVQLRQIPDLNTHYHEHLDTLFQNHNTVTWRKTMAEVREIAFKRMLKEMKHMTPLERVRYLVHIRKLPIFNDHRNNHWFTTWFWQRTDTVEKIDSLLKVNESIVKDQGMRFS